MMFVVKASVCILLALHFLPSSSAADRDVFWVSTWATPMHTVDASFSQRTIRMTLRTTVGGDDVRIKLSNQFGTEPLIIGTAYLGLHEHGPDIIAGSNRAVAFSGHPSVSIPPGAYVISDPVHLPVPSLGRLAVTVYARIAPRITTGQGQGLRTTYVSPAGDFAGATSMPVDSTALAYYWLAEVYVARSRRPALVVAFGDSITNGYNSTLETDRSWPGVVGELLLHQFADDRVSVINEGLGGNRILLPSHDTSVSNALARFDRDALDHPGVSVIVFLEGINDIGSNPDSEGKYVTADELEYGTQQLITRCHLRGIKIVGGTLLPYGGAPYFTNRGEKTRRAFNEWIRNNSSFDAVIDFEQATQDPGNPDHLLPAYDSGDHLHPSDAGYAAMAQEARQVFIGKHLF